MKRQINPTHELMNWRSPAWLRVDFVGPRNAQMNSPPLCTCLSWLRTLSAHFLYADRLFLCYAPIKAGENISGIWQANRSMNWPTNHRLEFDLRITCRTQVNLLLWYTLCSTRNWTPVSNRGAGVERGLTCAVSLPWCFRLAPTCFLQGHSSATWQGTRLCRLCNDAQRVCRRDKYQALVDESARWKWVDEAYQVVLSNSG